MISILFRLGIILLVIWLIGMILPSVGAFLGSFIHIILVIAVILIILKLLQGKLF